MPWLQVRVHSTSLVRPFISASIITMGCAGIAFLFSLFAFTEWFNQLNIRPDFGTNGLLWYTTAALTFHITFYPIFQVFFLVTAVSS